MLDGVDVPAWVLADDRRQHCFEGQKKRLLLLLLLQDGHQVAWHDETPPQALCCGSPPRCCSYLLLGYGEGLGHFNHAALGDDHIFEGPVATVRLCALDLMHHILNKKTSNNGRIGKPVHMQIRPSTCKDLQKKAHCFDLLPALMARDLRE